MTPRCDGTTFINTVCIELRVPRVLLVEDDELLGLCGAEYLARFGYDVHQTTALKQSLEELGESEYDLVLTDLHLSPLGGEGFVIARCAREHRVPVLLWTAADTASVNREAEDVGIAEVIPKSTSLAEVVASVERLLGKGVC